jgi:hypothetical protein
MEWAVEATSAECELGIPPTLNSKAQFHRRVLKNSTGTLAACARVQATKAEIRIWLAKMLYMAARIQVPAG